MMVVVVVIGAAAIAGMAVVVATARRPRREIASPHAATRRIARWLVRHPRLLERVERHLDSATAAGVALTALLVIAAAGFGVVGALLALLETGSTVADVDMQLAKWGADNATDDAAETLRMLTRLGATETVAVVALVLGAWDLLRGRRWAALAYLVAVIGGVTIILNVVKAIVDRDRPALRPLANFAAASFPSGHSATAAAAFAAFAVVVGRHRGAAVKTIAAGAAAFVAFAVAGSRIFLGVHWLSDVIAGVAMGWGWFAICTIAFGGRLLRLGAPIEAAERVEQLHHARVHEA